MAAVRPYTQVLDRLKAAGLRPTRQRMSLAKLLLEAGDRHLTAEQLHCEAVAAGIKVSLATVYNTLHQFTDANLLREVVVESGRAYFDTNTTDHHHIYYEDNGDLHDIPQGVIAVSNLPEIPGDATVERVDVIVRVRKAK